MTYKDVATMVESIGLPCAYYQFPDNTQLAPPFICFFYDSTNDVYAENKNYQRITGLIIEFYSDEKDFYYEALIEDALTSAGLTYRKYEQYLDSEHMHETVYETEVLITQEESNGEQS